MFRPFLPSRCRYEPHLAAIPYEAPDPGSLPVGPKTAEVTRRQVMPKMIPVKRFMRLAYAALASQVSSGEGAAPKSPRGAKFSPRKVRAVCGAPPSNLFFRRAPATR